MWRVVRRLLLLMVLSGCIVGSYSLLSPNSVAASTGINPQLSFEGKIVNTNGTNVTNGTYNLEFKIYQDGTNTGSGSTLKWTEDYLVSASQGVVVTNGTFQVNLGSITGTLASSVDWNQSVLWLSMQVGNTSSCTPAGNFTANCGGDGEMTPYISLTATPYALNADKLDGINSTAFGQLANNQTWTGTNTFQPATNINGVAVRQTSAASPTADIFDVQGTNGTTNFLQVTSTAANQGAVTLQSVGGSNALSLTSAGALSLTGAAASTWDIGNNTLSLQTTNNGAITTGTGLLTVGGNLSFGQASTIGTVTAVAADAAGLALTVQAGTANSSTTGNVGGALTLSGGNAAGSGNNNGGNILIQAGAKTGSGTSGSVSVQPQAGNDSTTAFQIQNAAGSNNSDSLLALSSVYNASNLVTNGSFEQNTTGWAAEGNMAISQDATQSAPFGSSDLKITNSGTPVALNGAKYAVNMTNGTVYSLSFYARAPSAFATLSEGWSNDGTNNLTTNCSLVGSTSATDWNRFICTFTYTGTTNNGVSYIFIGQNDTTSRTWYVDGVSLEAVNFASYYKEGTLNLNGLALGNTLIQPATNSTEALVVASVNGTTGLRVNTDGSLISSAFAANFTSTLAVTGATTLSNTLLVNSTSTNGFRVRNATSLANLINTDTTTINNSDTNGSFENSTSTATGYATNHAGVTLTVDTTAGNAYEGGNTGKVVATTSAVANSGIDYPLTTATMASATTYTLSFYAKLVAGQSAFTTLTAGRAENGATETACVLNSTTVSSLWQHYTCTFTTATTSGTPYFYIGQTDAGVAHQYYLDGIQFTAASSATANYHEGNIQLNGVITSPGIFQNNSDGTGVFQVQNAEGNTALNIDTNTNNLVTNSGFENGAGGWFVKGIATVSTDSTAGNVYQGDQSLKAAVTTTASSGMTTSLFNTTIAATTDYQLTFFAKCDSTYNTFTYGRQDVAGTDVNSTTSATCNTNWQQYTAHWTTGGTITNPKIYANLGSTTAGTIWIDNVSLVQTNTNAATNYNVGNISLGGVITSPTIFQNTSNSTLALQVQNTSNNAVLTADTTNNQLVLGQASALQGALVFSNSLGAHTVTLAAPTSDPAASYTLNLPTTVPTTSLCLQSGPSTATQLVFGSCGGAGSGVTSVGTFDGGTPNATGATITSGVIYLQSASGTNPGAVNTGTQTFAGAKTFTGQLQIGSATTDTTQVLLQLDSFSTLADTATCTTSTNQGALYYNTNSNNVRACINGGWQDLVSTAGLSQMLFGVVPNSGPTPGDLVGINGNANSPCKVYWASATTYSVSSCLAYSGGREVSVAAVTGVTITGMSTTNIYENICLNSSGVPTQMAGATATDGTQTAANLTAGSTIGAPLLCLATLKGSATTANNLAAIYDVRTFTNTTKTYETINSATQTLGGLVQQSTTAGLVSAPSSATATNLVGVIVAGTNAASSTSPNILVAIAGPQWVKATGTSAQPTSATASTGIISTTTAGYSGTGTALTTANATLGGAQLTIATSCSTNSTLALTDCQDSQFTDININ